MSSGSIFTSGLSVPYGIANSDFADSFFVTTLGNNRIVQVNRTNGSIINDNFLTQGNLSTPLGIVSIGAYLYVACRNSNSVVKIDISSQTIVQTYTYPSINQPYGLAWDGYRFLFVGNDNNSIARIDLTFGIIFTISLGNPPYNRPLGLAYRISNNRLFIANESSGTIYYIDINPITGFPNGPPILYASGLSGAFGLAFDSNNNLYCSLNSNSTIVKFDPFGNQSLFGLSNYAPSGYIAINANNDVFCTSPGGGLVVAFVNSVTTVISVDSSFNKVYGDSPFNLDASSNSPATINYSSNNTGVATVDSSGLVTIVSPGSATITVSQNAVTGYTSAFIFTIINVSANSPSNPAEVSDGSQLNYFLTSNAEYCDLTNDIVVNNDLVNDTSSTKYILNNSGNNINITRQ